MCAVHDTRLWLTVLQIAEALAAHQAVGHTHPSRKQVPKGRLRALSIRADSSITKSMCLLVQLGLPMTTSVATK